MYNACKKPFAFLVILFFLALACVWGWRLQCQFRQHQLDRALFAAIKGVDVNEALAALAAGANPNARDVPPDTRPIWQQMWDELRGMEQSAPTALQEALDPSRYSDGYSPADVRAITDSAPRIAISDALLENGASVNEPDWFGDTPLCVALEHGYRQTAMLLLEKGASPNNPNDSADVNTIRLLQSWAATHPARR